MKGKSNEEVEAIRHRFPNKVPVSLSLFTKHCVFYYSVKRNKLKLDHVQDYTSRYIFCINLLLSQYIRLHNNLTLLFIV